MAADMNARALPTPGSPPVAEYWWDIQPANSRVAAFLAGRLLNQLNWEFQLRILFHPRCNDDVDAVISKLVAICYSLLGVGQNTIETDLRRSQQWVLDRLLTEEVAERVDRFHFPDDPDDPYNESEHSLCQYLVYDGLHAITRLRKTFEQDLQQANAEDSAAGDLFACCQLGECLDQAIRRPDVYKFVSRKPETAVPPMPPNDNDNERAIVTEPEQYVAHPDSYYRSLGWKRLPGDGWQRPRVYAVWQPKPGELPPEDSWQNKIRIAARQATLPAITIAKLHLSAVKQDGIRVRTESFAKLICRHLTDPKPPEILPEWDEEKRELRFDGQVVRRYGTDKAETQVAILRAFEAEGWPPRIVCPDRLNVKQIRSAVKNFNRTRNACVIKLGGDGSGAGITWAVEPESASS